MIVVEAFGLITFCLVIYIICAMPTKKYIRRLLEDDGRRTPKIRALLEERMGKRCVLMFEESVTPFGVRLEGTLVDIDDEWLLVECPKKKGDPELKAVRLELVTGIEEPAS